MSHESEGQGDQATELKRLVEEVQNKESERKPSEPKKSGQKIRQERDIDILNLPPRTDVHSSKKNRTRIKINSAMLRLIFVIIVIIFALGGSFYLWGEEILKMFNSTFAA